MWKGGNTTQRGYGHQWRKIRKRALDRDSHLCQSCIKDNRYTPATDVDHIVNKAHGGTDELSNLQSLCRQCHKAKTSRKQSNPCDHRGIPLDSNHHWNTNP